MHESGAAVESSGSASVKCGERTLFKRRGTLALKGAARFSHLSGPCLAQGLASVQVFLSVEKQDSLFLNSFIDLDMLGGQRVSSTGVGGVNDVKDERLSHGVKDE